MKNVVKVIFLTAPITLFSAAQIQAQPPANHQQKKSMPAVNDRTPRTKTDQPPVTGNNKNEAPVNKTVKNDSPVTKDRTPRTFTDQPPVKEVPKNYPPANAQKKSPKPQPHRQHNRKRPPHEPGSPVKP
jgi:hypothetical protein